jgi:hypothetical protein
MKRASFTGWLFLFGGANWTGIVNRYIFQPFRIGWTLPAWAIWGALAGLTEQVNCQNPIVTN